MARGESIHLYTTQRHKKTCWAMELLELCATSIFFHLETFGINKKSMSFGVLVDIVSPHIGPYHTRVIQSAAPGRYIDDRTFCGRF